MTDEHAHDHGHPDGDTAEEHDGEREALRLLALAQIRQYPDPVLRMRARDVEVFDDDLRALAERLTALMEGANGAGLAATQIGILRRVFVFRPGDEAGPLAVVNPSLVQQSEERDADDEGCLSLQGVLVPVVRPIAVNLVGKDVSGGEISLALEGFPARAAQHELDHLEGVLILDRTTDEARRTALAYLRPKPVLGARV